MSGRKVDQRHRVLRIVTVRTMTRRAFAAAGASWLFAWERVFAQERVDIPSANATLKTLNPWMPDGIHAAVQDSLPLTHTDFIGYTAFAKNSLRARF